MNLPLSTVEERAANNPNKLEDANNPRDLAAALDYLQCKRVASLGIRKLVSITLVDHQKVATHLNVSPRLDEVALLNLVVGARRK